METREMTLSEFIAAQENVVNMLKKRDEMNAAIHESKTRWSPVTLSAISVLGYLQRAGEPEKSDVLIHDRNGYVPHRFIQWDETELCAIYPCASDDRDKGSAREDEIHQS